MEKNDRQVNLAFPVQLVPAKSLDLQHAKGSCRSGAMMTEAQRSQMMSLSMIMEKELTRKLSLSIKRHFFHFSVNFQFRIVLKEAAPIIVAVRLS